MEVGSFPFHYSVNCYITLMSQLNWHRTVDGAFFVELQRSFLNYLLISQPVPIHRSRL